MHNILLKIQNGFATIKSRYFYDKKSTCLSVGVALVVLLGIIGRFFSLKVSFEYDELFTAITTDPLLPFSEIVKRWLIIDVHPPLYNFLLWLYNHLFPSVLAEWKYHLPSLLCSLLALFFSWKMFPWERLGKTTQWLFVCLMATSFPLLHFASQARSYSLVLLLSVLFTFSALDIYYFLCSKQSNLERKTFWVFWISGLLLGYSHYFGMAWFYSLLIGLLYVAFRHKKYWKTLLWGGILVGAIYSLWLIPNALENLKSMRFGGDWWANEYAMKNFVSEFNGFLFGGEYSHWVWIFVSLASVFCLYKSYKKEPSQRFACGWLLLGGIGLVFLVIYLMSFRLNLFVPRFFYVIFPAFYLITAMLWNELAREYKRVFLVVSGLFLLFCLWHSFSWWYYVWQIQPDGAKLFTQYFMQSQKKELFVLIREGLPDQALRPMMSWYLNKYFKKDNPVTVLNILPKEEIEQAFKRADHAMILFPQCRSSKLELIRKEAGIERELCLINIVGRACEVSATCEEDITFYLDW